MYYGGESAQQTLPDQGLFLTPDPTIAKRQGDHVSAFLLPRGRYFYTDEDNPTPKDCKMVRNLMGRNINCTQGLVRLMNSPTPEWIALLASMGYDGFIKGDYLFVFHANKARHLGEYDFDQRTVVR
jgi:hypothetical protein